MNGDSASQGDASGAEKYGPGSTHARVAFVVDANITSYLMMGSVSPGSFALFCVSFSDICYCLLAQF